MPRTIDETHDPGLRSWVPSANAGGTPFPIQNLPFGMFRRRGGDGPPGPGVAIGEQIVDLRGLLTRGLLSGAAAEAASAACAGPMLNGLAALGASHWGALRLALSRLLREGAEPDGAADHLVAMADAEMALPVAPANYTDFFASLEHASNAGQVMRPGSPPVNPNFRWFPIAYHGRASSIRVSGTGCRRPWGVIAGADGEPPAFGPTQRLDYETELAWIAGPGNQLGSPIPLAEAEEHLFGLCLLNDWSARDIQRFEYQPLGPFLGKSFLTTLSPWVVTLEALAPFRVPARPRSGPDEPPPLPHLTTAANEASGAFDIEVSAQLRSAAMHGSDVPPLRLGRANARSLYWTPGQMLAHHTSNGCDLRPGDVVGTGTISGFGPDERGCLLEITANGTTPVRLPDGSSRSFLADGDELTLLAGCRRPGFVSIGFGPCAGVVCP